jgi:hypothetical protein
MIAAIRVIEAHLVAEIGKTALDDRVLREMARCRDMCLRRSRSNT